MIDTAVELSLQKTFDNQPLHESFSLGSLQVTHHPPATQRFCINWIHLKMWIGSQTKAKSMGIVVVSCLLLPTLLPLRITAVSPLRLVPMGQSRQFKRIASAGMENAKEKEMFCCPSFRQAMTDKRKVPFLTLKRFLSCLTL
jgi:hypothetical protein